jgi:hypothetical protein
MNKIIVNCTTNETETIDLTEEEIALVKQKELDNQAVLDAEQAEAEAKATAKAALLTQLGITEEQAKLLLN